MGVHGSALSCFFIFKNKITGVILKAGLWCLKNQVLFFPSMLLFHILKHLWGRKSKCLFEHCAQLHI